jgi:hypothetical protein
LSKASQQAHEITRALYHMTNHSQPSTYTQCSVYVTNGSSHAAITNLGDGPGPPADKAEAVSSRETLASGGDGGASVTVSPPAMSVYEEELFEGKADVLVTSPSSAAIGNGGRHRFELFLETLHTLFWTHSSLLT